MARRGRHGQHGLPLAISAPTPSRAEVSLDMLPLDLEAAIPISAEPKKTGQIAGLCRQATPLRRDADLRPPRPAKARCKQLITASTRMSREKNADARLVQIEGFDPEEVAMLSVETCLEKLGLKNGTPVIPRSSRDVAPNHHSLILRAVPKMR